MSDPCDLARRQAEALLADCRVIYEDEDGEEEMSVDLLAARLHASIQYFADEEPDAYDVALLVSMVKGQRPSAEPITYGTAVAEYVRRRWTGGSHE